MERLKKLLLYKSLNYFTIIKMIKKNMKEKNKDNKTSFHQNFYNKFN